LLERSISVPVLYYHSIGDHNTIRPWSFLSFSLKLFQDQIKYLYKNDFHAINLEELYNYMKYNAPIQPKSIVITFDDGFLDNWVFAFPILKKYNMKATIYVNPSFVDKRNIIRPTIDDVWSNKLDLDELDWWGYLSWDEMKKMEETGLIDIQSHAYTHTWYFCGYTIVDFYHPHAPYYWLYWNEFPEKKSQWLTEYNEEDIEYGRPIYAHGKALVSRQYFEDTNIKEELVSYVKKKGNRTFFESPDWKKKLFNIASNYISKNKLKGEMESEKQYEQRIYYELAESKKQIEDNLEKQVKFLCWPGGGCNSFTLQIAKNIGYISTTKGIFPNKFGNDSFQISRISAVSPLKFQFFKKEYERFFLKLQLNRGQDKLFGNIFGKALKNFQKK